MYPAFSADDLLIPGGDEILVQRLQTGGDVFLVPAIRCGIAMSPLRRNPIFRDCVGEDPVEFRLTPDPASLEAYARRAMTLEAFVGFMTAVVVKAETWCHIRVRTDYFGTCRALGARLIPLLLQNGAIVYMNPEFFKSSVLQDLLYGLSPSAPYKEVAPAMMKTLSALP
jgi:hypothetical protein